MQINKFIWVLLTVLFAVGCSALSEGVKTLAGTSTKALEKEKGSLGQSRVFRTGYPKIYEQVCNLLKAKNIALFLHSQKKHRIVAMHFLGERDSTEVGIFFEEISQQETKVIITSLSPGHLKLATTLVFSDLEKNNPADKKEESNENN